MLVEGRNMVQGGQKPGAGHGTCPVITIQPLRAAAILFPTSGTAAAAAAVVDDDDDDFWF